MFSSYYMSLTGHVSPNKMSETDVQVVVISPEDREQVERLVRACPSDWGFEQDAQMLRECTGEMQAALRSLIEPSKPEEPTGLGAVVEDASGDTYVRTSTTRKRPWSPARETGANHVSWSEIDAHPVKVLSEGVTADV